MNDWLNLLGLANKAGKVVTGEESIISKIRKNQVALVIVAKDAANNTKKLYANKCDYYHVDYCEIGTINEISSAIGKVNRVAVGICDHGFAKGLLAKITK
ncbi:MAG TPA: ribosomal L7Ae/L30e/S12e/Gadd45 family protein [Haloplasmataceae bacterium]